MPGRILRKGAQLALITGNSSLIRITGEHIKDRFFAKCCIKGHIIRTGLYTVDLQCEPALGAIDPEVDISVVVANIVVISIKATACIHIQEGTLGISAVSVRAVVICALIVEGNFRTGPACVAFSYRSASITKPICQRAGAKDGLILCGLVGRSFCRLIVLSGLVGRSFRRLVIFSGLVVFGRLIFHRLSHHSQATHLDIALNSGSENDHIIIVSRESNVFLFISRCAISSTDRERSHFIGQRIYKSNVSSILSIGNSCQNRLLACNGSSVYVILHDIYIGLAYRTVRAGNKCSIEGHVIGSGLYTADFISKPDLRSIRTECCLAFVSIITAAGVHIQEVAVICDALSITVQLYRCAGPSGLRASYSTAACCSLSIIAKLVGQRCAAAAHTCAHSTGVYSRDHHGENQADCQQDR